MKGKVQLSQQWRVRPVHPQQARSVLQLHTRHVSRSLPTGRMRLHFSRPPGVRSSCSVTENSKETTLAHFRRDMHAQSSVGPRQSLLKTWIALHNAWFGQEDCEDGAPRPFPLTVFSLHVVGAMLKQGGYRSVANYYSRAKEEHIARGHPWSELLQMTVRKATSSITRGIGPACQSSPLDLAAVWSCDVPWCPDAPGLPLGGKLLVEACSSLLTWSAARFLGTCLAPKPTLQVEVNFGRGSASAYRVVTDRALFMRSKSTVICWTKNSKCGLVVPSCRFSLRPPVPRS